MRSLLVPAFLSLALAVAAEPEISFDLRGPAVVPKVVPEDWKPGTERPPAVALRLDKEHASLTWTDPDLKAHEYTLDVLANHPGPRPWSQHLAWIVARSKDDFWILWAYFNETGTRCWINYYHFAENVARMSLFQGQYLYRPPDTFTNSPSDIQIPAARVPEYKGPGFRHRDFSPAGGKFRKLKWLDGAVWKDRDEELTVKPLIHLNVPGRNGWASEGWTEIHALAWNADATKLYYVVTYTAVDHGWAVDLTDGTVIKTHFGEKVVLEQPK